MRILITGLLTIVLVWFYVTEILHLLSLGTGYTIPIAVISCWHFVLMMTSYIRAVRTDPGYVKCSAFAECPRPLLIESSPSRIWLNSNPYTCKMCNLVRPARAHHCKRCRACVERMDHHCFWTQGCIGKGNLLFYIKFLVNLEISIIIYSAIAIYAWCVGKGVPGVGIYTIVSIVQGMFLTVLNIVQITNLTKGRTMIEEAVENEEMDVLLNLTKMIVDQGQWEDNLRTMLGKDITIWSLFLY